MILSEYLSNPDKLVIVVVPVEKRLFPKDHGSQHTTQAPHVQTDDYRRLGLSYNKQSRSLKNKPVIIHLVVDQQLWPLEVPTCNSHVVLLAKNFNDVPDEIPYCALYLFRQVCYIPGQGGKTQQVPNLLGAVVCFRDQSSHCAAGKSSGKNC